MQLCKLCLGVVHGRARPGRRSPRLLTALALHTNTLPAQPLSFQQRQRQQAWRTSSGSGGRRQRRQAAAAAREEEEVTAGGTADAALQPSTSYNSSEQNQGDDSRDFAVAMAKVGGRMHHWHMQGRQGCCLPAITTSCNIRHMAPCSAPPERRQQCHAAAMRQPLLRSQRRVSPRKRCSTEPLL